MTDRTRFDINVVHVDPIPEGVIDSNGACFPQKGKLLIQATVQWNPVSTYVCDCV